MAVEQLWIRAEQHQLGVHPVSPVFLYARSDADFTGLSAAVHADLQRLAAPLPVRRRARRLGDPGAGAAAQSRRAAPAVRSQRLDRSAVMSTTDASSNGRGRSW